MTRAIALASGYSYSEIRDKLYYVSQLLECDELCVCCYQHLLDNVFGYSRLPIKGTETVDEIALQYPNSVLLIRVKGHLTCVIHGDIYDIWDCGDEIADIVWVI